MQSGTENVVEEWLKKTYEGMVFRIVRQYKEDLKLPNHLMGHRRLYLQLCFRNISDLLSVRRDVMPLLWIPTPRSFTLRLGMTGQI